MTPTTLWTRPQNPTSLRASDSRERVGLPIPHLRPGEETTLLRHHPPHSWSVLVSDDARSGRSPHPMSDDPSRRNRVEAGWRVRRTERSSGGSSSTRRTSTTSRTSDSSGGCRRRSLGYYGLSGHPGRVPPEAPARRGRPLSGSRGRATGAARGMGSGETAPRLGGGPLHGPRQPFGRARVSAETDSGVYASKGRFHPRPGRATVPSPRPPILGDPGYSRLFPRAGVKSLRLRLRDPTGTTSGNHDARTVVRPTFLMGRGGPAREVLVGQSPCPPEAGARPVVSVCRSEHPVEGSPRLSHLVETPRRLSPRTPQFDLK